MAPRIGGVIIQAPGRLDYLLDYASEFFGRERPGQPRCRPARRSESAHVCFFQASQDDDGRARRTNIHRLEHGESLHAGIEINDDGRDVFEPAFNNAECFTAGVSTNELVAGSGRRARNQGRGVGIGTYEKKSLRFHLRQINCVAKHDSALVAIRCA